MVSLSNRLGEIHGVAAQRRDTVDEQEDVQSGGGGGGRGDSVRTSVRPRAARGLHASHHIASHHRIGFYKNYITNKAGGHRIIVHPRGLGNIKSKRGRQRRG